MMGGGQPLNAPWAEPREIDRPLGGTDGSERRNDGTHSACATKQWKRLSAQSLPRHAPSTRSTAHGDGGQSLRFIG